MINSALMTNSDELTYAKKPRAPVGPKTLVRRGKVTVKIEAKNKLIATAKLIPTSNVGQSTQRVRS